MINIIRDQQALLWENIQNKPTTYPSEVSWSDILSKPYTYPAEVVSTDITVYLSPTGSDDTGDGTEASPWATLAHALSVLYPTRALPGVTVTIQFAAGDWALTSSLANIPANYHLYAPTSNRTVSSIQSSSGSSGAYSLVVNLDDVTGITTDDYIIFHSLSGGTGSKYLAGYWPVTAIDTGNNRVTVTTTHNDVPSGAVIGSAEVVTSRITWTGCHGLTSCACKVSGVGLHGDSSYYAIYNHSGMLTTIGLTGWSRGIYNNGVSCNVSGVACVCTYQGLTLSRLGVINAFGPIVSFAPTSIYLIRAATANFDATTTLCVGNITTTRGGVLDISAATVTGNVTASEMSMILASGTTITGTTSPAINTVGNNNSIIIG